MVSRSVSDSSAETAALLKTYTEALEADHPPPLAAILSLCQAMSIEAASTTSQFLLSLHHNSSLLMAAPGASYGCQAGARLFERWVRDAVGSAKRDVGVDEMRIGIIEEGRRFAKNGAVEAKDRIAKEVQGFLKDDCVILTQSYSSVVLQTLQLAHAQNKRVNVYVTVAEPESGGLKTHAALTALGIPCTVILDSAVGYVMDRVDVVLVGSEAVVESGGLVAGLGTYQIALLARALNKPFYALAESYKFLRLFPLSQTDLPLLPASTTRPLSFLPTAAPAPVVSSAEGESIGKRERRRITQEMLEQNPRYDYTPREYVSLVMSDVGILTPESVSSYCGIFTE